MRKLRKNRGILFWITGLSGSGKTAIAEKIKDKIKKNYGPTLTLSGDDLRKIFNYKKFSRNSRIQYALNYSKFCRYITNQNINVIFSTVSLFHKVRNWNRTKINNYVEIYIETDIKKVLKRKSKYFYKGNHKNVMGKNLKAEFPKSPDIIIKNNFTKPLNKLSQELMNKILNLH